LKRKTEERVKEFAQAWKDLQKILGEYRNKDGFSDILVGDLEDLSKSYEKGAFITIVEGIG